MAEHVEKVFIRPGKPVAEMTDDEIDAMSSRLYRKLVEQRDSHRKQDDPGQPRATS